MIYCLSVIRKPLTLTSKVVMFASSNKLNKTRDKLQLYLPHHPVPHKSEKDRRVCNAAAKYQNVALNDKLLFGPELLQRLIGIVFRFREHQIAFSADIEAMFLQVAVPSDDKPCLRFLWPEDPQQRIEDYEYTRHVFGVGQKARRLVQITLCIKWRKITRKIRKILSKLFSKTSTWTISSSQSEYPKKRLKSTRKSERSSAKVDSI